LHQPQALSWPPLPTIAFHRRSVSAWSSVATWNGSITGEEIAGASGCIEQVRDGYRQFGAARTS
jgi:hypothetical protein